MFLLFLCLNKIIWLLLCSGCTLPLVFSLELEACCYQMSSFNVWHAWIFSHQCMALLACYRPPLHPYRTVKMFRHSAAILQKVFFQFNLTQSDPSVLESYFREVIRLLLKLPRAPSGDVSEKEQKGNKESSKDSVVV